MKLWARTRVSRLSFFSIFHYLFLSSYISIRVVIVNNSYEITRFSECLHFYFIRIIAISVLVPSSTPPLVFYICCSMRFRPCHCHFLPIIAGRFVFGFLCLTPGYLAPVCWTGQRFRYGREIVWTRCRDCKLPIFYLENEIKKKQKRKKAKMWQKKVYSSSFPINIIL